MPRSKFPERFSKLEVATRKESGQNKVVCRARCNHPVDRDCPLGLIQAGVPPDSGTLAILATQYACARRWFKKVRHIVSDVVSGR